VAVRRDRVFLVTTIYDRAHEGLGGDAYSYYFAYEAFKPLLERYCAIREVERPESSLAFAARKARAEGLEPIHLAFLPLQKIHFLADLPTIAFPFWEFPDIPNRNLGNSPRENWRSASNQLAGLIASCQFTRNALVDGGVKRPLEVLPVPVEHGYRDIPDWPGPTKCTIRCRWRDLKADDAVLTATAAAPEFVRHDRKISIHPRAALRFAFRATAAMFPSLTGQAAEAFKRRYPRLSRALLGHDRAFPPASSIADEASDLVLSGYVFTSIFNPFDGRKNWQDLLSAALLAFADKPDATIVLKLVVPEVTREQAVAAMREAHALLKIRHACRLVVIADYLTEQQMLELAAASSFYVNATRAEGACMPLRNFMAAGRPGISPDHTAMAEYFDDDVGLMVGSSPEPTFWPHDPDHAIETRWARLDWTSLFDALRRAYSIAADDPKTYRRFADAGRRRMAGFEHDEALVAKVAAALERLTDRALACKARGAP
jgi:glycosyltransferase involved in cell wall biosynthesis